MAAFKCKMCGGDLNIIETDKVVECEYCGTTQTVPSADNEKKMTLFNRANRLRLNNEFDKAAALYEQLIAEFPEEAEAYWGLCLCNWGIEYVDDPATGEKKPTCHRASFESLMKDENYVLTMEYADVTAQRVYRREAQEIDRLNDAILSVSRNEKPYDVFICYKETDDNGMRTNDSVLAQDIYDALTAKGLKVFFSRITLEDKLGRQYEPYIFAALNSAKVMLTVGTTYEHFHAVWVKNEWSRFLRLAAKDRTKVLIPCFRDMDPYDLPDEFKGLQAQDLGKLGAVQDIVRGVEKLLAKEATAKQDAPQAAASNPASATVQSLLKRAFMFLEDGEWQRADEYAEKVLDIDPENGEAYLAKAMSDLKKRSRSSMNDASGIALNANIQKALRFGSESLKNEINGYIASTKAADERRRKAAEEAEAARRKAAEEAEAEAQLEADKVIAAFMAKQNRIDAASISGSGEYSYSRALKALQTKPRVLQIASEKQPKLVPSYRGFVTIPFGRYPQASKNKNAPIEWLVLKIDGSRALLISKYALDCRQYNTSCADVTWETCTLRKWLNGMFLNAAFSKSERAMILNAAFSKSERAMIPSVTVSADKNPRCNTSPGNSKTDHVFLLSITEVNKYFSSHSARQCQVTAYCYVQGAYKADNGNCWWWLRSPGVNSSHAAGVYSDGSVDEYGHYVNYDGYAVRPALWIDLGS